MSTLPPPHPLPLEANKIKLQPTLGLLKSESFQTRALNPPLSSEQFTTDKASLLGTEVDASRVTCTWAWPPRFRHILICFLKRDKNKQQAEPELVNSSAAHLLPHQQKDFCLDFFLLCFMRNKFSSISGPASFCFFLFFFLLAASRNSWAYSVLLPCAWKMDLWCFLRPLDVCFSYPLGKSSSILWPLSTSLLCFFALCLSAWDFLVFLWCSWSLLCLPCSLQGFFFFLWLYPPCFSSCHGISDCSGRRPASCSSVKQIIVFQKS